MQLIFETEATVNIVDKMSNIDAMPIAESIPDSLPDVNKALKSNGADVNNIIDDSAKTDENGTSEKQNGNKSIAMTNELSEACNEVTNDDKENIVSAQNGNGDISKITEADEPEAVLTKETEVSEVVPDTQIAMQIEDIPLVIPKSLETNSCFNSKPENKTNVEDSTNLNDATQQDANVIGNQTGSIVSKSDTDDLDLKKDVSIQHENTGIEMEQTNLEESNILLQPEITNSSSNVEINQGKSDVAKENGDACHSEIDSLIAGMDSTNANKNQDLTEQNEETKTDCNEVENKTPENSIDKNIIATELANASEHITEGNICVSDEPCEDKIKDINESQENIMEPLSENLDLIQCENGNLEDNEKEGSVLNENIQNCVNNLSDDNILNPSEQKNSVNDVKKICVENSNQLESDDNPNLNKNEQNDSELQNLSKCESIENDESEVKKISDSQNESLKQNNVCEATALEPMDVDATEDLSKISAIPSLSKAPANTALEEEKSDEIIAADSCKINHLASERISSPVTIIDCDEIQEIADEETTVTSILDNDKDAKIVTTEPKRAKSVSGLSNTLDILSDEDDGEVSKDKLINRTSQSVNENKCINLDEDDDVMLIDDSPTVKLPEKANKADLMDTQESKSVIQKTEDAQKEIDQINTINLDNDSEPETIKVSSEDCHDKVAVPPENEPTINTPDISEKVQEPIVAPKVVIQRPIIPENFLKAFRKNVVDMNRDELEEFCLMKIVEGIIDQNNLSEIKTKLKTMASYVEEWKKKVMALTKQNRDLQIVLKTVQDEQKKRSEHQVVPLKITRSVGMQVYMAEVTDRNAAKRKPPNTGPLIIKNNRNTPPKPNAKPSSASLPIPVPRLVPAANNSPMKQRLPQQVQNATVTSNSPKQAVQNGMKTPSPAQKSEKRPFSSVQSVTVDLTDDEPPAKQPAPSRTNSQQAPVRLVAQQQLMKPRPQLNISTPRKVFIPINPQNSIRPGQTITLKSVQPNVRIRAPNPQNPALPIRVQTNPVRVTRPPVNLRHPAPLPEVAKQQQPPNWKALPPAPDLKISKVENGIVISWKIEGYQEDSYEEIASYQLYAYQETSSPPSTLLWKKIGDVKALPLPMACTLTQFMAGYKYFFAVRAVDIRSRIGAFSLPGSILLLNK